MPIIPNIDVHPHIGIFFLTSMISCILKDIEDLLSKFI